MVSRLQQRGWKIMRQIKNKDVTALRKTSRYFYYKSGIYRRLIEYLSTMFLMYYKVIPRNSSKFDDANFKKSHDNVFDYIKKLDLSTFNEVSTVVFTEGVFFGYQRQMSDGYVIQQLPTDYCRSIAKYSNGNYVVEFDLKFFDSFKTTSDGIIELSNLYPRELVQAWLTNSMSKDKYRWHQISAESGMCFQFDDMGMPPLTGMFVDLIELDNYKKLEKIKTALDLVKIIIQKIPLDEDKQPAYELEDAQAIHDNLTNMLKNTENVDGYTTPFDVDVISLGDKTKLDTSNTMKAERSVFTSAGMSSNLGNAEGNIAMLNSIRSDSAWVFELISQYQKWIDSHINTYITSSKNYNFDFEILPITWYNLIEWQEKYYTGATSGVTKLEYAISLGVKQSNLRDKLIYENDYLNLDEIITPLMTAHTATSDNTGGAPSKSDDALTPSGVTSRETNESR